MNKYKIELTYFDKKYSCQTNKVCHVEVIEIETDRIEWSMEQYGRNRESFTWRIINEG